MNGRIQEFVGMELGFGIRNIRDCEVVSRSEQAAGRHKPSKSHEVMDVIVLRM